ncbi:MAG: type 2 isopentenyl-diphosphate Delta-isomerase [Candidatus Limnocylindrales bacterium]
MNGDSTTGSMRDRKAAQLELAARPSSLHAGSTGLERLRLRHRALPGRDLADVSLRTDFLGARLAAPLLVSSMTGGTQRAREVNSRLAHAAAKHSIGMALGSGRALLADPSLLATYRTEERPPLLLANLGPVQLRLGLGPADAERLVELLGADGMALHLNPLQEAVQPEGETQFGDLLDRIAAVVERLRPRPVVVKEVGFGLGPEDVAQLAALGVAAVDVAGAGGTNWASVEGQRDPRAAAVAEAFAGWGWPTATALQMAAPIAHATGTAVIASGGIANGVEAATALALGAQAVGIARPFLLAALDDRADEAVEVIVRQLRLAVWLTGRAAVSDLSPDDLLEA